MKRYVGEIAGLLVLRIIDCAEEIGAQSVAGGAENHCTLAAVTLVPPLQVDLVILLIVVQASTYWYCRKSLQNCHCTTCTTYTG